MNALEMEDNDEVGDGGGFERYKLRKGCGEGNEKYCNAKFATAPNAMAKTMANQTKVNVVLCPVFRMSLKAGTVKTAKTTKVTIGRTTSRIPTAILESPRCGIYEINEK